MGGTVATSSGPLPLGGQPTHQSAIRVSCRNRVSPALGSQSGCLQQSLARRLAPAYPLILERQAGGNQHSPWGTDTVAVVWTQVLGVPFGSPSSSLASGPSPSLAHQPVGTRTEMPLATRPHPPAHTPNAQPPLDRALPTRGPRTMGTWPHASVHRCAPRGPAARGPAPMSSKPASASGPASPSSRQTPALGPHSPADSPAGWHLSWDQLGPEFCPLANENNKHNDLKIYTTQQEQLWEVYSYTSFRNRKNPSPTLHLQELENRTLRKERKIRAKQKNRKDQCNYASSSKR